MALEAVIPFALDGLLPFKMTPPHGLPFMIDRIKTMFLGSSPVKDSTATVVGSALDPGMDVIRQTQMIDGTGSIMDSGRMTMSAATKKTARKPNTAAAALDDEHGVPFRPVLRPPTAFLAAMDDGSNRDHELFRLRGGTHVIGREQGEITFPHEVLMSARHAQIQCLKEGRGYVWQFTDLNSRNGSFFRVQRAMMKDGQEFMIGAHRFAFRVPLPDGGFAPMNIVAFGGAAMYQPQSATDSSEDPQRTQMVGGNDPRRGPMPRPRLFYRSLDGVESSLMLNSDHVVIGSDAATCAVSLPGDRFICRNHARLMLDKNGWILQDLGSKNATWVRLHQARLDQATEFQLGEQRFYFRPHESQNR